MVNRGSGTENRKEKIKMNITLTIIEGICILGLMIVSILTGIKIGIKKAVTEEMLAMYYKHITQKTEEQLKEIECFNNMSLEEKIEARRRINSIVDDNYTIERIKCIMGVM